MTTKNRRDNTKKKLKIAIQALEEIASGICCGSCEPNDSRCSVGYALEALQNIKDTTSD